MTGKPREFVKFYRRPGGHLILLLLAHQKKKRTNFKTLDTINIFDRIVIFFIGMPYDIVATIFVHFTHSLAHQRARKKNAVFDQIAVKNKIDNVADHVCKITAR